MKRCKKTEGDFVCVRIADHNGACDLVQREVFEKAMKDNEDAFLRGDLVNGSAVGLLTGTVKKPAGYSVKCTCGRRTPFAHMHAESCVVYQPQLFGRAERVIPEKVAAFEEAFQIVFETYNRPGTDFASDSAWATWQHAQVTKAFSLMQVVRKS